MLKDDKYQKTVAQSLFNSIKKFKSQYEEKWQLK